MNKKTFAIITLMSLTPALLHAPAGRVEARPPTERVNAEIERVMTRRERIAAERDTAQARLDQLEKNFDRARLEELRAKMKQSIPSLREAREMIQLRQQEGRVNQAKFSIDRIQARIDATTTEINNLFTLRSEVIAYPKTYATGRLPFEEAQSLVDNFVQSTKKLVGLTQEIVTSITSLVAKGAVFARETVRFINYKLNGSKQDTLDSMGIEIRRFLATGDHVNQFRESFLYLRMREVIEEGRDRDKYPGIRLTFSPETFRGIKAEFDANDLLLISKELTPEQQLYRDTYCLFEAMRQEVSGEVTQFAPLDAKKDANLTKIIDPYLGRTLGWLDGRSGDILAPRAERYDPGANMGLGEMYSARNNMELMERFLRVISKRTLTSMDADWAAIVPNSFQEASLAFLDITAPQLTRQLDRNESISAAVRAAYSDARQAG